MSKIIIVKDLSLLYTLPYFMYFMSIILMTFLKESDPNQICNVKFHWTVLIRKTSDDG